MRPYYIHFLIIALGLMMYFVANVQRVAIPGAIFDTLQIDFNLKAPEITCLGAMFMYAYAVGLLCVGILIDKFSGVKIMLIGAIIFTLGSILFLLTQNTYALYLARIFMGFGSASFYLSILQETKKCFPDKYYGIIISIILMVGFLGGVFANAPFVVLSNKYGWKLILTVMSSVLFVGTLLYAWAQKYLTHIHDNQNIKISFAPFKEAFENPNNCLLFGFVAINNGIYYTLLTVIGLKFLKDYLGFSSSMSALIISIMTILSAVSGIGLASLSKIFNNQRTIFLKLISLVTMSVFVFIFTCIMLGIKTLWIAFAIMFVAISGGVSPLTVPIVVATNRYEIRTTTISIMNSTIFFSTAILGSIIGYLLLLFQPQSVVDGCTTYANNSYLVIFGLFSVIALLQGIIAFGIQDKI